MTRPESRIKITASICFALIIAAIILIRSNPVTGYELSVYSTVPRLAWLFLGTSIFCGISIVVDQAFASDEQGPNLWVVGLILVIVSNLVILSLPLLQNVAFHGHGGDVATHMGYVKDIITTGGISPFNLYPLTHVWIAAVSITSNTPPMGLSLPLSILFYPLLIYFIYILSAQILPKPAQRIATLISALTLFYFYTMVFPQGFSTIFLVLALFLFFKTTSERNINYTILFIFVLALFPIFHITTGFIVVVTFIAMEVARLLFNRWHMSKVSEPKLSSDRRGMRGAPSLICLAIMLMWIWNHFSFWENNMLRVVQWFRGEINVSMLTLQIAPMLAKLHLSQQELIELGFRLYGYVALCVFLAFLAALWVFRRMKSSPSSFLQNMFILSVVFLFSAAIELQHLYRPMIGLSWGRFLDFIFMPSIILASFYLCQLVSKYRGNMFRLAKYGIVVFMVVISANCVMKIYSSPSIYMPSEQTTQAELQGWRWLISEKDEELKVASMKGLRIPDMLRGTQATRGDWRIWRQNIPDHFGYDQFDSLSVSLNESLRKFHKHLREPVPLTQDFYMPLSQWDRQLYVGGAWSRVGSFKGEDFDKLESDHSVNRIYTAGEMEVLWIEGSD